MSGMTNPRQSKHRYIHFFLPLEFGITIHISIHIISLPVLLFLLITPVKVLSLNDKIMYHAVDYY